MKDNKAFLSILKNANLEVLEDFTTTEFIDTGSYALNALISASVYGGVPNNRATMWAGDPSTGKTFLTLANVKTFLELYPNSNVVYYDTEFALDKAMIDKRGIDTDRLFIQQPETLQDFRTSALNLITEYEKSEEKTPLMLVLDSLGNLPTAKEIADSASGAETRDMTKAQIIKSIFRILTIKLGKNSVPLLITNHTYDSMSLYSPKEISGGSGAKYASSTIITLTKSKDKDDEGDVVGNIIRATTYKSRYSKENQKVELKLDFKKGLDRYYGLLDLAEKYDIIKKVKTRYEMPDGSLHFGKAIKEDSKRFFTKDILDRLDVVAKTEFALGGDEPAVVTETQEQDDGN